jgi:hypothetical protein
MRAPSMNYTALKLLHFSHNFSDLQWMIRWAL